MNERINLLLNEYLKENQYKEYNNVLKKEITIFFVKLIQKKNKNYLYGTFAELAEDVERYLENKLRENFELEGTPIVINFKNKHSDFE